jgi:hypothetical protein
MTLHDRLKDHSHSYCTRPNALPTLAAHYACGGCWRGWEIFDYKVDTVMLRLHSLSLYEAATTGPADESGPVNGER